MSPRPPTRPSRATGPGRTGATLLGAACACAPIDVDFDETCQAAPEPCRDVDPFWSSAAHRYSFDAEGDVAFDSISGRDGALMGSPVQADGDLTLNGNDQYVDLPDGLISRLESATFEAWVSWSGGGGWQRIFDFGDDAVLQEGQTPSGRSYLFATPSTPVDLGGIARVAYRLNQDDGVDETVANSGFPLTPGERSSFTVVVDSPSETLSLYVNARLVAATRLTETLSTINDVNNWIGRSQYATDPDFAGTVHEFRIYASALTSAEIQQSHDAGPDAAFTR